MSLEDTDKVGSLDMRVRCYAHDLWTLVHTGLVVLLLCINELRRHSFNLVETLFLNLYTV